MNIDLSTSEARLALLREWHHLYEPHFFTGASAPSWCAECEETWPCPTRQIVDGTYEGAV